MIKRRRRAVPHRNKAAGNHGKCTSCLSDLGGGWRSDILQVPPCVHGHQDIDTDDDIVSPETRDNTPEVRKANVCPGLAGSATAGGANLSLPLPKPD